MKKTHMVIIVFIMLAALAFIQNLSADCDGGGPTNTGTSTDLGWVYNWTLEKECGAGNGDGRNVVFLMVENKKYQVDWCYASDCETSCPNLCPNPGGATPPPIKDSCSASLCGIENVKTYVKKLENVQN